MRPIGVLWVATMVLVLINDDASAGETKKKIDFTKAAVVMPFESSLAAVSSVIPGTTRIDVIDFLKTAALFSEVLTPEEAKDRDKATLIEITGTLIDYSSGRTTQGLFGSGYSPASAVFDITIRDSATGTLLWERRIHAASIFPSSFPSSKSRILAPPANVADYLVKEMQVEKRQDYCPISHIYGYVGSMFSPSKKAHPQLGGGMEVRIRGRLSLNGETSLCLRGLGNLTC
jgi:hypothetical protein